MLEEPLREALTFDDVLLVPSYSEVIPRDVDVTTRLTPLIPLRMPLVSSAMDTVTEAATAIRMAREGGMGFIHKNLTIEEQAREVNRVKKAKDLLHKHRIEKLLVVDGAGKLKGLITIRDIEQAQEHPAAAVDELGRLRVGAAVGVGVDREARIEALVAAGCDVICIDTAHG